MKTSLWVPTFLVAFSTMAAEPHPVTLTFYIDHVQCSACADAIADSVKQVKSVTDVKLNAADSFAQISFDTHASSAHQIAQAVADAAPQHGEKYVATMKCTVPDYAKDGNAAKVDEVFAKRKAWVKVETVNRDKGEFVIHFLPLKVDPKVDKPQGWNPGHFGHAIHDPAPKGLGLAFAIQREGAPAAKKKKS